MILDIAFLTAAVICGVIVARAYKTGYAAGHADATAADNREVTAMAERLGFGSPLVTLKTQAELDAMLVPLASGRTQR